MPKPNNVGVGTAMLVLNAEGKILLGKRKGAHRSGHWSFPGGWLDRADDDTTEAAIRETLEETGLVVFDAEPHIWLTEDHPELEIRTVTLYHITRDDDWLGVPMNMEPNKCEGWQWFDLDDLPSPLFPGLEEAVTQLQDLSLDDRRTSATRRRRAPYTQAPALISRKDLDTLIRMREGSTVAEIATALQRPEDKIRTLLRLLDREGAEFVLGMDA